MVGCRGIVIESVSVYMQHEVIVSQAFGLSVLRRVSRTNWILPRFGVLVAFDENWVGEVDVVRVE